MLAVMFIFVRSGEEGAGSSCDPQGGIELSRVHRSSICKHRLNTRKEQPLRLQEGLGICHSLGLIRVEMAIEGRCSAGMQISRYG